VDALVFLLEVMRPVGVEVAVGQHGAEGEDGFGSGQAPAGAGEFEPVFDQVAAGAFDGAGGDGPAGLKGVVVAQVGRFAGEVGGGFVGALAFGCRVAVAGGPAADAGGDVAGFAGQEFDGLVGDLVLGVGVAGVEERPGGSQ